MVRTDAGRVGGLNDGAPDFGRTTFPMRHDELPMLTRSSVRERRALLRDVTYRVDFELAVGEDTESPVWEGSRGPQFLGEPMTVWSAIRGG